MSVEEQIKTIAKDELQAQLDTIEEVMRSSFRKESNEFKEQLQAMSAQLEEMGMLIAELNLRTENLEEDLNNRLGLIMKLRINTLGKLISEYKRLMGILFPNLEESAAHTGVEV